MHSTARDIEILKSICEFPAKHRYPPTFRDIQAAFDFSSPTIVVRAVKRLRQDGLVLNRPDRVRRSRVLVPTKKGKRFVSLLRYAVPPQPPSQTPTEAFPRGNSSPSDTDNAPQLAEPTQDYKDIALGWLSQNADRVIPLALMDHNLVRFHRGIARDPRLDDQGYPLPSLDPQQSAERRASSGLPKRPSLGRAPEPTVVGSEYQWLAPLLVGRSRQPDYIDFWYRAWLQVPEIELHLPFDPPQWVLPDTLRWQTVAMFIRGRDQPLHEVIVRTRRAAQYSKGVHLGIASSHQEDRDHLLRLDILHVQLPF